MEGRWISNGGPSTTVIFTGEIVVVVLGLEISILELRFLSNCRIFGRVSMEVEEKGGRGYRVIGSGFQVEVDQCAYDALSNRTCLKLYALLRALLKGFHLCKQNKNILGKF